MTNRFERKYEILPADLVWHDLPAGLSVFLFALPLCLGISWHQCLLYMPVCFRGSVGGLVVSLSMNGSSLGVSGPAADLTTVIGRIIRGLGSYRIFLLAVIVAMAFISLLLGLFRLGAIATDFHPP